MIEGELGDVIALGRTSDVRRFGADSVVKVPHPHIPTEWAHIEAAISSAVHQAGLPAPEVRDLIAVDGRPSIVFEYVAGPSMWQCMHVDPGEIDRLTGELVAIQRAIFTAGIPDGVPDFVDRLLTRIRAAPGLTEAERSEAESITRALPRGAALLHGDLHPGNILMARTGPVVIDWFDAAVGHPVADIVRTSILIRPGASAAPDHLPGATDPILKRLCHAHLDRFGAELDDIVPAFATWVAVAAAGRLAERAEADDARLIEFWRDRPKAG